ncbi:hypothetical protein EmuJ_000343300 [Echinococcus multilocularis]|uniref:Uncharacterized protein n=1 Tax=Echinococcus multilocularis TaxID=6211 RepID=A0A068Y2L1_ECHMU|nr:hypothetical protein EmuJ_000343300 [Echinococcus multilocularis]
MGKADKLPDPKSNKTQGVLKKRGRRMERTRCNLYSAPLPLSDALSLTEDAKFGKLTRSMVSTSVTAPGELASWPYQ